MSNSATKKSDNIGVHLASLKKLPEIISSSIEVEIHPDYTKVNGTRNASNDINYETLVHRFYGAANIDNVVYRIKTTMRENISNSQQTTAHSYEVTKIELVEAPFDNTSNMDEHLAMTSTDSKKIGQTEAPSAEGNYSVEPMAMTSTNSNRNELIEAPFANTDAGEPAAMTSTNSNRNELVEAPFANNVTDEPVAMTSTNSISAAKLLIGVEKSYEPGVKVLSQKNKPHSYKVRAVEFTEESAGQKWSERHGTASVLSHNSEASYESARAVPSEYIRAAKLLNGVEKSYEPGVKVLDVSEKTQNNAGDVMHSFEVTKIELLPEDNNSELEPTASNNQGQQTHRTTKLLNGVEKSYEPGVKVLDVSEMKEHELTQGNLLYIYMVDKMSDGRMKLRKMGLSKTEVENITAMLDPRFKQLADWMQDEFLVEKREEYNEVYKRMFGTSMAAIENYFLLKISSQSKEIRLVGKYRLFTRCSVSSSSRL